MKKPEKQEIEDFISSHWNNAACPLCGGKEWHVSDRIFELREFDSGEVAVGDLRDVVSPVVPVTCRKCGNTVLINTIITGLLKE